MARIKLELPSSFIFSTQITVRISDVNYGGHLSNDAVLALMHEVRMQFLKHYKCTELDVFGTSLIMADTAIVFKAEGFYGDVLKAEVTPSDFARASFDLNYRFTNEKGIEIARGKTGMVCFDYKNRKVVAVPEAFVKFFS